VAEIAAKVWDHPNSRQFSTTPYIHQFIVGDERNMKSISSIMLLCMTFTSSLANHLLHAANKAPWLRCQFVADGSNPLPIDLVCFFAGGSSVI